MSLKLIVDVVIPYNDDRYLWPASWGPTYAKSYFFCILAFSTAIAMLWVYRLHLTRLNEKAEKHERTFGLPKGFRYMT